MSYIQWNYQNRLKTLSWMFHCAYCKMSYKSEGKIKDVCGVRVSLYIVQSATQFGKPI